MSIEAVARVLRSKETKGNDRLVLIALADYANDDGTGVYPSIPKIAAKANCDHRTVERCLDHLVEKRQIEEVGKTPKGTRAWRVLTGLTPVKMSGVDEGDPRQADDQPPAECRDTPGKLPDSLIRRTVKEPSKGTVKKQKSASRSKEAFRPDPEDPVDAVIVEIFDAWHTGTDKNGASILTKARASNIRGRLKEAARGASDPGNLEIALSHAKAEVLEAVAGMVGSKWHRENQHQDFTQLFRGRDRIEFFVGRHREQKGKERPDFDEYEDHVERPEGGEGGRGD